jgi:hypothetical protein
MTVNCPHKGYKALCPRCHRMSPHGCWEEELSEAVSNAPQSLPETVSGDEEAPATPVAPPAPKAPTAPRKGRRRASK